MRCFRCDRYFAPSTCDACLRTYWLRVAQASRAQTTESETPDSPPPSYEEAIRAEVPPLRVFVNVATGQREVCRGFRRILTTR
jgi:hypothetical protein